MECGWLWLDAAGSGIGWAGVWCGFEFAFARRCTRSVVHLFERAIARRIRVIFSIGDEGLLKLRVLLQFLNSDRETGSGRVESDRVGYNVMLGMGVMGAMGGLGRRTLRRGVVWVVLWWR